MLEGGEFLFVAFALALELFRDFLLEDESFEGVVALLFGALEARTDAVGVVFVLLDEGDEAAVFALVDVDFGLEVLGFFGEGFGEGLEFEELDVLAHIDVLSTDLALPAVSSFPAPPRGNCSSWRL